MSQHWSASLREKLDNHYQWPAMYTFKFIVPKGKEQLVREIFPIHEATEKQSQNGNYISITATVQVTSADDVIAVYQKAYGIEGIIAL